MKRQRVAILGIGNPRVGPSVIGALATYFGEEPIEVAMYDPDPDRLELFARFAHVAFKFNKTPHDILVCEDFEDAVPESAKVIVSIDEMGAKRLLRLKGQVDLSTPVAEAVETLLARVGPEVDVLELTEGPNSEPGRYRLPLPDELSAEDLRALPHQILRWVRGEEYLHEFLAAHDRSAIKAWLERPESAFLG